MNKRGQALVEFVLILPVILIMIMSIICIGNIYLEKYKLNNALDTCTSLYLNDKNDSLKSYIIKQDISFTTKEDGDFTEIEVSKSIDIPVLKSKQYVISASKKVYNDE